MDYRFTTYCSPFLNVYEKKLQLAREIKKVHPKSNNFYKYISDKDGEYKAKFLAIYNNKCVYCGNNLTNLSIDLFEIDHFKCDSSFVNKIEANNIFNLVSSCQACNRLKSDFLIGSNNYGLFDVEHGLPKIFYRDEKFYIKINDKYKDNEEINKFYNQLHLGFQTKRIDYLLIELDGIIKVTKNIRIKEKLLSIYNSLKEKRCYISSYN